MGLMSLIPWGPGRVLLVVPQFLEELDRISSRHVLPVDLVLELASLDMEDQNVDHGVDEVCLYSVVIGVVAA